MSRFFVDPSDVTDRYIYMTDAGDLKHMKKVLRMSVGDELDISDGAAWEYHVQIESMDGDEAKLLILDKQKFAREPELQVTLYQGVPKAGKMEGIIQKCVELGIDRIVAVSTERAIVKLDKKEAKKLERWQKIAEAAAKQSGRGKIPEIGQQVLKFKEAVAEAKTLDGAIIPYEKEQETGIRQFAEKFQGESIGVFIGPEGGFAEEEIALAQENGITPITLGKRILRTETAGMTTVAILLYELD